MFMLIFYMNKVVIFLFLYEIFLNIFVVVDYVVIGCDFEIWLNLFDFDLRWFIDIDVVF